MAIITVGLVLIGVLAVMACPTTPAIASDSVVTVAGGCTSVSMSGVSAANATIIIDIGLLCSSLAPGQGITVALEGSTLTEQSIVFIYGAQDPTVPYVQITVAGNTFNNSVIVLWDVSLQGTSSFISIENNDLQLSALMSLFPPELVGLTADAVPAFPGIYYSNGLSDSVNVLAAHITLSDGAQLNISSNTALTLLDGIQADLESTGAYAVISSVTISDVSLNGSSAFNIRGNLFNFSYQPETPQSCAALVLQLYNPHDVNVTGSSTFRIEENEFLMTLSSYIDNGGISIGFGAALSEFYSSLCVMFTIAVESGSVYSISGNNFTSNVVLGQAYTTAIQLSSWSFCGLISVSEAIFSVSQNNFGGTTLGFGITFSELDSIIVSREAEFRVNDNHFVAVASGLSAALATSSIMITFQVNDITLANASIFSISSNVFYANYSGVGPVYPEGTSVTPIQLDCIPYASGNSVFNFNNNQDIEYYYNLQHSLAEGLQFQLAGVGALYDSSWNMNNNSYIGMFNGSDSGGGWYLQDIPVLVNSSFSMCQNSVFVTIRNVSELNNWDTGCLTIYFGLTGELTLNGSIVNISGNVITAVSDDPTEYPTSVFSYAGSSSGPSYFSLIVLIWYDAFLSNVVISNNVLTTATPGWGMECIRFVGYGPTTPLVIPAGGSWNIENNVCDQQHPGNIAVGLNFDLGSGGTALTMQGSALRVVKNVFNLQATIGPAAGILLANIILELMDGAVFLVEGNTFNVSTTEASAAGISFPYYVAAYGNLNPATFTLVGSQFLVVENIFLVSAQQTARQVQQDEPSATAAGVKFPVGLISASAGSTWLISGNWFDVSVVAATSAPAEDTNGTSYCYGAQLTAAWILSEGSLVSIGCNTVTQNCMDEGTVGVAVANMTLSGGSNFSIGLNTLSLTATAGGALHSSTGNSSTAILQEGADSVIAVSGGSQLLVSTNVIQLSADSSLPGGTVGALLLEGSIAVSESSSVFDVAGNNVTYTSGVAQPMARFSDVSTTSGGQLLISNNNLTSVASTVPLASFSTPPTVTAGSLVAACNTHDGDLLVSPVSDYDSAAVTVSATCPSLIRYECLGLSDVSPRVTLTAVPTSVIGPGVVVEAQIRGWITAGAPSTLAFTISSSESNIANSSGIASSSIQLSVIGLAGVSEVLIPFYIVSTASNSDVTLSVSAAGSAELLSNIAQASISCSGFHYTLSTSGTTVVGAAPLIKTAAPSINSVPTIAVSAPTSIFSVTLTGTNLNLLPERFLIGSQVATVTALTATTATLSINPTPIVTDLLSGIAPLSQESSTAATEDVVYASYIVSQLSAAARGSLLTALSGVAAGSLWGLGNPIPSVSSPGTQTVTAPSVSSPLDCGAPVGSVSVMLSVAGTPSVFESTAGVAGGYIDPTTGAQVAGTISGNALSVPLAVPSTYREAQYPFQLWYTVGPQSWILNQAAAVRYPTLNVALQSTADGSAIFNISFNDSSLLVDASFMVSSVSGESISTTTSGCTSSNASAIVCSFATADAASPLPLIDIGGAKGLALQYSFTAVNAPLGVVQTVLIPSGSSGGNNVLAGFAPFEPLTSAMGCFPVLIFSIVAAVILLGGAAAYRHVRQAAPPLGPAASMLRCVLVQNTWVGALWWCHSQCAIAHVVTACAHMWVLAMLSAAITALWAPTATVAAPPVAGLVSAILAQLVRPFLQAHYYTVADSDTVAATRIEVTTTRYAVETVTGDGTDAASHQGTKTAGESGPLNDLTVGGDTIDAEKEAAMHKKTPSPAAWKLGYTIGAAVSLVSLAILGALLGTTLSDLAPCTAFQAAFVIAILLDAFCVQFVAIAGLYLLRQHTKAAIQLAFCELHPFVECPEK